MMPHNHVVRVPVVIRLEFACVENSLRCESFELFPMFTKPNGWPHVSNHEEAPHSYVQAKFQAHVLHDAFVDTKRFPQSSVEDVLQDLDIF